MLHRAVREGWPSVLAAAEARGGMPKRVREEVRRYLACGDLRRGFVQARVRRFEGHFFGARAMSGEVCAAVERLSKRGRGVEGATISLPQTHVERRDLAESPSSLVERQTASSSCGGDCAVGGGDGDSSRPMLRKISSACSRLVTTAVTFLLPPQGHAQTSTCQVRA